MNIFRKKGWSSPVENQNANIKMQNDISKSKVVDLHKIFIFLDCHFDI